MSEFLVKTYGGDHEQKVQADYLGIGPNGDLVLHNEDGPVAAFSKDIWVSAVKQ